MHIESQNAAAGETAGPSAARIGLVGPGFYFGQHNRVACAIYNLSNRLALVNHGTGKYAHTLGVLRADVRNVITLAESNILLESTPARCSRHEKTTKRGVGWAEED
jgi:hypothetical protein